MDNFYDEITRETFFISKYSIVIKNGVIVTVDLNGCELRSPKTGNRLKSIPKSGIPQMLVGNNKESLKKMLKKRSSDHYKKEIEEVKRAKINSVIKKDS